MNTNNSTQAEVQPGIYLVHHATIAFRPGDRVTTANGPGTLIGGSRDIAIVRKADGSIDWSEWAEVAHEGQRWPERMYTTNPNLRSRFPDQYPEQPKGLGICQDNVSRLVGLYVELGDSDRDEKLPTVAKLRPEVEKAMLGELDRLARLMGCKPLKLAG